MRTRLYNEYGAGIGEHCDALHKLVEASMDEVLKYCDDNNLDLRDAHGICNATVDISFAGHVLMNAFKMKKAEKNL